MTVNLPADEFRNELNRLIDNSWVKLDAERMFELFSGGPLIPFRGSIFGNEFTLKRNVPWNWRSSKYLKGIYFEKNGVTEVSYSFVTDYFQFVLLRLIMLPVLFLMIPGAASSIPGLILSLLFCLGVYFSIHFVDAYFKRKLETSFLTEMNMVPYNYKSRFKK